MASFLQNLTTETKKILYKIVDSQLSTKRWGLTTYSFHNTRKYFDLVKDVKRKIGVGMSTPEAMQLCLCAISVGDLPGEIAEAGVYKGGTAAIIAKVLPKKKINLFDTFEGLPELSKNDKQFKKGEYVGTYDEVRQNLIRFKNIVFYKGLFPNTVTAKLKKTKFCFVHLDLDLYQSTKDGLNFFYPRMSRGGIILIHDYPQLGVIKAIDEFLKDKQEKKIILNGPQCMIVKL